MFNNYATAASDPPKESEPVSPIKIFAGGHYTKENLNMSLQLNHKKLKVHLHLECIEFEDIQKISCYLQRMKLM